MDSSLGSEFRFERRTSRQFIHVVVDSFALAFQKPLYRMRKRGLRQPVGAGGFDRHQGACHFVFALRAALKALETMFDAPLQGLVVAGFEMQAIDPLQRAPVAAIGNAVGRAALGRVRFAGG